VNQNKHEAAFAPFQNDSQVFALRNLRIENGIERLNIFGELGITRSPHGLEDLKALSSVITAAIQYLEAQTNSLTEHAIKGEVDRQDIVRKNPFSR